MSETIIFFAIIVLFFILISFGWGILGIKTCDTSGTVKYIAHTIIYLLCSLFIENILWKIESMPVEMILSSSVRIFIGKLFFICEIVFGLTSVIAVLQNLINYFKGKK